MAHFLKPKGASGAGFQQRADGAVTAMTIAGGQKSKEIVLWGGGRGGEKLSLVAYSNAGKRIADCYLTRQEKHDYDPDGDHLWYYVYTVIAKDFPDSHDLVVSGTLTAVDKAGMPFARIALSIEKMEVERVSLPVFLPRTVSSVTSSSFLPFRLNKAKKGEQLTVADSSATICQMRLRLRKGHATYWVGAAIPQGVKDFTKAYIFFHPDTMGEKSNATYESFGADWEYVERYVVTIGTQIAEAKGVVVLVPFMTQKSRTNSASTNMFAERGVTTIMSLMGACAMVAEEDPPSVVRQIGVISFSSGIQHLVRFSSVMAGSGIIKEQIDLDGAHYKIKHNAAPKLKGVKNIMVTQEPPKDPTVEWIYLPASAWKPSDLKTRPDAPEDPIKDAVHTNIGCLTIRAVVGNSVIP